MRSSQGRSNCRALRQRDSLLVWFDPETEWPAVPGGRHGRPACFSDATIEAGVQAVIILDGRLLNASLIELFTDYGAGSIIREPGAWPCRR